MFSPNDTSNRLEKLVPKENHLVSVMEKLSREYKIEAWDKLTPGHIHGFLVHLPNGWTVSVQFGPGNYGTNYDASFMSPPKQAWHATEAECWAHNKDHSQHYPDNPEGWLTISKVLLFIEEVAQK